VASTGAASAPWSPGPSRRVPSQVEFLRPLLGRSDVELVVRSGTMRELLAQLEAHTIDVVLSTTALRRDAGSPSHCHLLDEQPVSLVAKPHVDLPAFRFPADLASVPIVVPSLDSDIRTAFDRVLSIAGVHPLISAEVDDMAMLRLIARESGTLTLVPPIVVQDELSTGVLVEVCRIEEVTERFYAILQTRRFPNSLLAELMRRFTGSAKA
jgi:LysR family transcriptional activator of nhaA